MIRLRSLKSDRNRVRNGQLVITDDGLGSIKEYMAKRDEQGRLELPNGVNVAVRNLKYKGRIYGLNNVQVVDIVDVKTGTKYPAVESDYLYLLLDDAPVEFRITRKGKAILTERSRKQLRVCKVFSRKQNGIKIFKELTDKGIWTPLKH